MNVLAIIPSRYASTRFPGKPLIDINGKSMIQRVYEQAKKAFEHVVVATDDKRIEKVVLGFNGEVVMTSIDHKSGTDRCAEAVKTFERKCEQTFEFIINVQGDEPFIQPEQLELLAEVIQKPDAQIGTLVKKIQNTDVLFDPNIPKVILNKFNEAIYFSRQTIPYLRNLDKNKWLETHTFYKHIGLYAYRKNVLFELTKLPESSLEKAESLEQLRWIENGYKIHVGITEIDSISIDTMEDLENLS